MGDASSCTRRKGSAVSAKASYRDRSSLLGTLSVLPALDKHSRSWSSSKAQQEPAPTPDGAAATVSHVASVWTSSLSSDSTLKHPGSFAHPVL